MAPSTRQRRPVLLELVPAQPVEHEEHHRPGAGDRLGTHEAERPVSSVGTTWSRQPAP